MNKQDWRAMAVEEFHRWVNDDGWDKYDIANDLCNLLARGRSWDHWDGLESWEICIDTYGYEQYEIARDKYAEVQDPLAVEWLKEYAGQGGKCDWDISEILESVSHK